MVTLTVIAYYSRRIIKYGSIGIVILLILRSISISVRAYWKKTHPPAPPPPTVAFGKLPKLKFPEQPGLPTLTFKLENISGTLPKLADRTKIFFIPKSYPNLLAWDKTRAWARGLGFTQEPQKTEEFAFRFTTESTPKTTLDVNVLTKNFTLTYDWQNDLQILSQGNPPQEAQAISSAKSFLQSASALTEDLVNGKGEVLYFKYSEGNLVKALFFSEANFAQVNIFRQDIDEIKVLPPNPKSSNVAVKLSAAKDRGRSIIEVKFIHFPVSLDNFATYPLKDATSAWNLLKNGKGFVANLGDNSGGNITIRNVYLAYYDSNEQQNFLQPVIVFEGDRDFYAYVPAVTDSWLEQ